MAANVERDNSPRFAAYFKVRNYEADTVGHVNNATYLHYLEQAAIEHSSAAGYPYSKYEELGGHFIVRRHTIEYLRPASPGDILQVITWVTDMHGATAMRQYEVRLQTSTEMGELAPLPADRILDSNETPDGQLLVRAETLWVFVDSQSGRPRRLPREMLKLF